MIRFQISLPALALLSCTVSFSGCRAAESANGDAASTRSVAAPANAEKAAPPAESAAPKNGIIAGDASGTTLEKTASGYRLLRDGKPYFVRGAGLDLSHSVALFKATGGNSIRTWGAEQLETALPLAEKNGLTVCAGIWLGQPRQGFSYFDEKAVEEQKNRVREAVEKYQNSPALLVWAIGNEAEGDGDDPQIFKAINDAAKMVKQLDPHHPVMTVFSDVPKIKIDNFNRYCTDVDILGINSYGGLASLADRLRQYGFVKPLMVTEWSALGPWEAGKSEWNAPFEMNGTERADFAIKGYDASIKNDPNCLGSYVFFWGAKQERTATWFGLLLSSGEKTPLVDELAREWTGKYPANRAPRIASLKSAAGNAQVEAGEKFTAHVAADDAEKDALQYSWEVRQETSDARSGGDAEAAPPSHPEAIVKANGADLSFVAPQRSGSYRIFVVVRDGKGGAVTANLPFFVK